MLSKSQNFLMSKMMPLGFKMV